MILASHYQVDALHDTVALDFLPFFSTVCMWSSGVIFSSIIAPENFIEDVLLTELLGNLRSGRFNGMLPLTDFYGINCTYFFFTFMITCYQ